MAGLQAYAAAVETPKRERSLTLVISERDRRQAARTACPELPLRCVSTGYLGDGCSCRSTIPMAVVAAAWRAEREHSRDRSDRFFRFSWRDGEWLAFGLGDGRIRGVYCPEHSAERAQRAAVSYLPSYSPVAPLPLSA